MKIAEIRELASNPDLGVPQGEVGGHVWGELHHSTKEAIWRMKLRPAPFGSAKHGEPVLFLGSVAIALQPDSKGKCLAARITSECKGFRPGWGNINVDWQWFPKIYQDDNGVPNQLVVTGDGFPMLRVRLGLDDVWRFDLVQSAEVAKARFGEKFDSCPNNWKHDIAFPESMAKGYLAALGLPLDTDPMTLMGEPVTEDQILACINGGGR